MNHRNSVVNQGLVEIYLRHFDKFYAFVNLKMFSIINKIFALFAFKSSPKQVTIIAKQFPKFTINPYF